MNIIVTGGAGFIGSAVIRYLLQETTHSVVNVDKLTYAGNLTTLEEVSANPRYSFEHVDICDRLEIRRIFAQYQPDIVMHLAAESHVDRSIDDPGCFIETNIVGTYTLLEETRRYLKTKSEEERSRFIFHHISTDEVYGDLEGTDSFFTEETPYAPSSPYSASKASSDHLVRAWFRTFSIPAIITNCSNNYGPYQYPEKLIPVVIANALAGNPIPVYGNGAQIRDWLYVEDHARALVKVVLEGTPGETYNIGGHNEVTNLTLVETVCALLDEFVPSSHDGLISYAELITFVADRPGHGVRYAIDASKIAKDLGWTPEETFATGLRKTVAWYLEHRDWWEALLKQSGEQKRLGLGK